MTETFVTRPGTTDFGKDYENINIARLIVKLLAQNVDNFVISSNDAQFGDFDDIVLDVESNTQKRSYALQLKHSNQQKRIQHHELTAPKGNFSIKKYFESYKKLPEGSNHQLIVFTNYSFKPPTELRLGDFTVNILQCEPNSLLNTSEKNGRCYKFEILHNGEHSAKEYESFFKRFFLYTSQNNFHKIQQTVSGEFQNNFSCTENEWKQFVDYITNWNKQSGQRTKLDQVLMKSVIGFHLLSPFIEPWESNSLENDKIKILRTAICTFDVTIFESGSYEHLKQIWGIDKSESENIIKEAKIELKKLHLNFDIRDVDKIKDKEWSIILWLMEKRPLILQNNERSLKAIQLFGDKKFVLLAKESESTNRLGKLNIFENLSNLMTFLDILTSILKTYTISIQGKEEITLKQVFQKRGHLKNVTSTDLLLMCVKPLTIGGEPEILPESYVSRHLTVDIIDVKYLKNIESDAWVFISYVSRSHQKNNLTLQYNAIEHKQYLKNKKLQENLATERGANKSSLPESIHAMNERRFSIFFKTGQFTEDEISDVLKTSLTIQKYHHVEMTKNGNLKWLFSNKNVSALKNYISDEKNFIAEEELYKWPTRHNINLILGEPGMGKSLLAKNLASKFMSDFWVVTLFAEDMLHICKQQLDRKKFEDFMVHSKSDTNRLEAKLLEIMIQRKKVIYIWDAIDEIPGEYLQPLTNLIFDISKMSVQFITSRPHLETYLEGKFNVFSMSLCEFTLEELISYTEKRLSNKISENVKEKVLELLQLHQNVFKNPLNLYILTELLQHNLAVLLDFSESFFNISDLFFRFFDEKFHVFYKKKAKMTCEKSYSYVLEKMIAKDKLENFKNFQKAAVKALVSKIKIDCENFLRNIQKNGDCFGIIIRVDDNNIPRFLHTSFAEYLVATHFAENYKNIPDLENIIFERQNNNIRYMFDLIMAKNFKVHVAVLSKNFDFLEKCEDDLINCRDLGGRTPLHLMCSWGIQYPRTTLKQDGDAYYIDDDSFEQVSQEHPKYTEMLFFLLNKCDALETDKIYDLNTVAYAEKSDCLYAKAMVLFYRKKKFEMLNEDVSLITVLYFSAVYGYEKVLDLYKNLPLIRVRNHDMMSSLLHIGVHHEKYLKKILESYDIYRRNIDIPAFAGITPFLLACAFNCSKSVQLLINYRANINTADTFGSTALHVACMKGNHEIVKVLIANNCNKNASDDFDLNTPLHCSCVHGQEEVVRILLESKVDINFVDRTNQTPLYLASMLGHVNIVKMLLENGADSEIHDNFNQTPLHIATLCQYDKVVQLLTSKKAHVNHINKQGEIPLHIASRYGSVNIVKMLIRAGSMIDLPDFVTGATPLLMAVLRKHTDVVKILLQSGADVNFVDGEGRTPLRLAVERGCNKIVDVLMEFGAKKVQC